MAHVRSMRVRFTALAVLAVLAAMYAGAYGPGTPVARSAAAAAPPLEVLWDRFGIPHIFAERDEDAFYGFGWAQMQAHGNLILRQYGVARGRGAEYWGEDLLPADRWVRTMGVPARAKAWYAQQRPAYRACLDAFVRGLNDYAARHADRLDPAMTRVLPVTAEDVLGHIQHVILFNFIAPRPAAGSVVQRWAAGEALAPTAASARRPAADTEAAAGSNAWAIGRARSASGHAMLLANPHLPWSGSMLWIEAHISLPGVNASGATLIGQPTFAIGFNDHLGWTHTVNTMDGADLYELTLDGDGYRWDGGTRAFEVEPQVLKVRQKDGAITEMPFVVKRSLHGPIVAERSGRALALRVVGLEQAHAGEQYWDMIRAKSLTQFQAAAAKLEQPYFTTMYADRDGHIFHLFGGRTPVRPRGTYPWAFVVPGDASASLWTATHPFEELPQVLDLPSGWLQNANDPPWTTTSPAAISADAYPAYMAPRYMRFRAQRSSRMLEADKSLTFEEVETNLFSTRLELADRLLDDLIPAARRRGGAAAEAAALLERWDRTVDAASRGGVPFQTWVDELADGADLSRERIGQAPFFAIKWDPRRPTTTPDGLADPDDAAAALERAFTRVQKDHGAADVAWGDVYRLRRDKVELAASGGPDLLGTFNVLDFITANDGKRIAAMGDSYIAVIEFGTPVRARALLTTGNWSQPGSPHRSDQIGLYAAKQLRPVWRTRADVEANQTRREILSPASAPR
jgi:acyl-homoserine-lactone acylase